MRRGVAILAIGLVAASMLAQSAGQLRVDVQLVSLNFAVDDSAGRPVLDLGRDDFTVLEDGQPREIKTFESAERR